VTNGELTRASVVPLSMPAVAVSAEDAKRLGVRWRSTVLPLVFLALAVHTVLPRIASFEGTFSVIRELRWWAVAAAVVAQAASYFGTGYTLHSVARLAGHQLSVWRATRFALAAGSIGLIAAGPVGYAPATYMWMRGRGMSSEGAMLSAWLPPLFNAVTLWAFTVAAIVILAIRHVLTAPEVVATAVLCAVLLSLLAIGLWTLTNGEHLRTTVVRGQRAWMWIRRREVDAAASHRNADRIAGARHLLRGGRWRRPFIGSLLCAGFDFACLCCVFSASRDVPTVATILAGFGLPHLVASASFLPGGLGVVEGGLVGLYVALGVPLATAVVVVLVYRATSFWLPMFLGFPVALAVQHTLARNPIPSEP
jgi:uncharacterized protein (TIRG00374 family)